MNQQINLRVGPVEFRWSQYNARYELARWHPRNIGDSGDDTEYCTVICFFHEDSEGWYMRTVGRRYDEALSFFPDATLIVSKYAFDVLMAKHEAFAAIADLSPHKN